MSTQSTTDRLAQWQADESRLRSLPRPEAGVAEAQAIVDLTGLQMMQAIMDGTLPPTPIGRAMAFGFVNVAYGEVIIQGTPDRQFLNPMGTMHGGWYATLLDSAMGCAVHTTLPQGRAFTTLEFKINLVRSVGPKVPLVRAEGRVVHVGRQVITAEGHLVGPDGTRYAHGTTTCLAFDMRTPG